MAGAKCICSILVHALLIHAPIIQAPPPPTLKSPKKNHCLILRVHLPPTFQSSLMSVEFPWKKLLGKKDLNEIQQHPPNLKIKIPHFH